MIGRPASDVSMGQRRLALVWDRLVLPDGRTVLLPEVPSQDSRGAAGLGASVNNHTGRTLVNAALLTLIGAGPALAQPNRGGWGNPSVGDVLAAETARQSAQVGNEVIRRGMDVRPTLSLPQGAEISVLLTADLELPAYR